MCELRRIKSIAPSNGNGFLSALWETLVVSIAIIVLLMLGNAAVSYTHLTLPTIYSV